MNTPYPITGTVAVRGGGKSTSWKIGEDTVWLSEHEAGDVAEQIVNDLRANHGDGTQAQIRVTGAQRDPYTIESTSDANWALTTTDEDDDRVAVLSGEKTYVEAREEAANLLDTTEDDVTFARPDLTSADTGTYDRHPENKEEVEA